MSHLLDVIPKEIREKIVTSLHPLELIDYYACNKQTYQECQEVMYLLLTKWINLQRNWKRILPNLTWRYTIELCCIYYPICTKKLPLSISTSNTDIVHYAYLAGNIKLIENIIINTKPESLNYVIAVIFQLCFHYSDLKTMEEIQEIIYGRNSKYDKLLDMHDNFVNIVESKVTKEHRNTSAISLLYLIGSIWTLEDYAEYLVIQSRSPRSGAKANYRKLIGQIPFDGNVVNHFAYTVAMLAGRRKIELLTRSYGLQDEVLEVNVPVEKKYPQLSRFYPCMTYGKLIYTPDYLPKGVSPKNYYLCSGNYDYYAGLCLSKLDSADKQIEGVTIEDNLRYNYVNHEYNYLDEVIETDIISYYSLIES